MSKHPIATLVLENGAKLIFTPCPGTKSVGLEESIKQLKQNDTSMLITLMFDEEMESNDVLALPKLCYQHKITWLQLPIIDDQAPSEPFEQRWQQYKPVILNELKNKAVVAVHCKGGTGRTGTVIAMLLLALGWPVNKIVEEVQKVRPKALRIQQQLDYLDNELAGADITF